MTIRRRNGRWWLAAALAAALGCSGGESEETAAGGDVGVPLRGGTAVVALSGEPDVLNPLIRMSAVAGRILSEIGAPLLIMNEDLAFEPRIASSWDVADDGLSVTYRLRPWLWSDGTPLGARDVVHSLRLIKDERVGSPLRGFFSGVTGAVALDDSTVRYEFAYPTSDPLVKTSHALLPYHVVKDLEPSQVGTWPINRRPLSSGAFMLESWDQNRQLVLVRNPHYVGEAPLLDRVVFRVLPEAETRLLALEAGEVDMVANISHTAAARLERAGRVRVQSISGRFLYFLQWNCRRPAFADADTRRALSLAIDRGRMVETLLGGRARPAVGPVAPAMWNHHVDMAADPFDAQAARDMLAAAGWHDADGDGVLDRGDQELRFEIIARQGDPVRSNGATMLRENLGAVGAEVSVRILERGVSLDRWSSGDFDAYFGLMNLNLYGDPSSLVHSGAADRSNRGGFADGAVDSLLELALATTDRELALPHWRALQERLARLAPAAWLFNPDNLVGVGPRLQNVRPHMLSPYNNLAEWWIARDDRKYRDPK